MRDGNNDFRKRYFLESCDQTLRIGRILAIIGVPLALLFGLQDVLIVGTKSFVIWRLLQGAPLILFLLLSHLYLKDHKQYTLVFHAFSLACIMAGMLGMTLTVFQMPQFVDYLNIYGVLNGLSIIIFSVFLFSGGLRKYLTFFTVLPLVGLTLYESVGSNLSAQQLSLLSNPLLASIAVSIIGFSQEKLSFKEFKSRNLAEEEKLQLQREKNFNESLIQTAQTIILLVDKAGAIVRFNLYMENLSGYRLDEISGKKFSDIFIQSAFRNEVEALCQGTDLGDQCKGVVIPLLTKDHRLIEVEWYNKRLVDENGQYSGMLCTGFDLTERRKAEQLRIEKELAEAKTSAKNSFMANLSHELRTPLNAILGFSALILDKDSGPITEKKIKFAEMISTAGKRLLAMINELMDLSLIEIGRIHLQLKSIDVSQTLLFCLEMHRLQAEAKSIHLSVELDEVKNVHINADYDRFVQVVTNLLSNALKFTDGGGTVGITAKITENRLTVSIWDTGIGMSEVDQEVIFNEFTRIETSMVRKTSGVGLGLTIAKKLVGFHHGEIAVKSAKGIGSTFTFTIPTNLS